MKASVSEASWFVLAFEVDENGTDHFKKKKNACNPDRIQKTSIGVTACNP